MNRFRFFSSGALFLFSVYCLIFNPQLPFELPLSIYIIATIYFAIFPIKDMVSVFNKSLYKGKQFKKNYIENSYLNDMEFIRTLKRYNKRACGAMLFWLIFMSVPGVLYLCNIIDKIWIFFFFALSNFSVFFAVLFWCPFYSIFIRPHCCLDCRIYNWDSFFQYSFLIFIPNIFTIILFVLGVLSLIEWEVVHALYPKRFYKDSNCTLDCEKCDMEGCHKGNKKFFSKKLKRKV